jgi:hypothetical protein
MGSATDAFVIMPFSGTATCTEAEWTEIFENVFKPALSSCGYTCERAKPSVGNLITSIVNRLRTARIVLADLTDRNPNVFYELGVRHSLRKGTIVVSQRSEDVPSDLRGYWFLKYGIRPAQVTEFQSEIRRIVKIVESAMEQSDNPVADYLDKENLVLSSYLQRENIKKLSALYTEITGNISDLAAETGKYVAYGCLELLLHTRYVNLGPDLLHQAYELWHLLRTIDLGAREPDMVDRAVAQLQSFQEHIFFLTDSILRNEFVEPPTVTMMQWVPSGDCILSRGSQPTGKSAVAMHLTAELARRGGLSSHLKKIEWIPPTSSLVVAPEDKIDKPKDP